MRAPSSSTASTNRPTPCCSKVGIKRGPWTPEEDEVLSNYVNKEGEGRWRTLPKRAGLQRCGKSCRLRWVNYLRPNVKRGQIDPDEEDLILRLHRLLGNRWSLIAGRIPGRTDNEIKNYWNTHLSKKLISQGIDPRNHKPLNPNPISSVAAAEFKNDHFVPPKNIYAPMSSSTPVPQQMTYQNPPLLQETRGMFNHEQASAATVHVGDDLSNVMDGQNEFHLVNQHQTQTANQPCSNDMQNLDRLITLHNNDNNVYQSYVTDPSCNYSQDTFSLFLDALINDSYGGTSYHHPISAASPPLVPIVSATVNYGQEPTWEAELGSAIENVGDQQQLNDILRHASIV